jgi:hypothetical protein
METQRDSVPGTTQQNSAYWTFSELKPLRALSVNPGCVVFFKCARRKNRFVAVVETNIDESVFPRCHRKSLGKMPLGRIAVCHLPFSRHFSPFDNRFPFRSRVWCLVTRFRFRISHVFWNRELCKQKEKEIDWSLDHERSLKKLKETAMIGRVNLRLCKRHFWKSMNRKRVEKLPIRGTLREI